MFNPLFIVGFVLLVTGLIGSRFLVERAMKLLSPDEKLALLDSFSRLRVFGSLPMVFVVFLFFGIGYLRGPWAWPAYFGACALLAAYFVIMHRVVSRRMRALNINIGFQAAHNKARWVAYSGILAFFVLVTLGPFLSR